ncbi:catenin alpha-1-like [Actinia tenebrosa]|uniref:Catenin alpha-1-like n=1 Tax=Actinia tenebrosa TaxID=6105 RepID=A0A6P8H9Y4_ACTTE|nr:catenin alpha-1-like [Actinia tenebrosa]
MSAKLLSSLVQTKSIELVMAPIAAQVSQLIILNEAGERDGIPMPNLVSFARQINVSIESLVLAAQSLVSDSNDEDLKIEMPEACSMLRAAGNGLHEATNKLLIEPHSHDVRYSLVDSARNILETTMNVLLVYDKAEVHKIVCAAHWVMDRLGLTEAVTSLKGFVVSFKGFSESLILLVSLCDKRQRELSNPSKRSRLLSAMAILKKAVGLLSSTMQSYLKNPTDGQAKANRDYVIGQIKFACTEIIKIVESRGDEDGTMEESTNMASTMEKAHHQLGASTRLDTSNQMDCYLDAIVRSSMAVAHTCDGIYKERIVQACQKVLETRNELADLQKAVMSSPDSLRKRREFDMTAEKLSVELKKLDRQVTTAIADQVSTMFCDVELPVYQLLAAATAPVPSGSTTAQDQALLKTRQKADQFDKHTARLVQVSRQAASVSADTGRVHIIKAISAELEKMAPVIATTACAVRQNPYDATGVERLGLLRQEWANRLQILTDAVDDVTDIQDLMDTTEAHVQHDVALCHEGLIEENTAKIVQASRDVLGRGHRVVQIAKKAMASTANPLFKGELLTAANELNTVLPNLSAAIERAMTNLNNSEIREKVSDSIRSVGEKIKTIKTTVTRPTGSSLDFINDNPTQSEAGDFISMPTSNDLEAIKPANGISSYQEDVVQPENERITSSSPSLKLLENEVEDAPAPRAKPLLTTEKKLLSSRPKSTSSPRLFRKLDNTNLSRSLESLLVKPLEDMKDVDKRALLGLGNGADTNSSHLSTLLGQPLNPSRTSRAPVTRLIRAAKEGDRNNIEKHIKNLVSQVTKLMELAEKCVEKSSKVEQVSQIRTASGEIEKLTPIITQAARDVTANSRNFKAVERLHMIGREWASKAHLLGNAIDEIVAPWSAAASKLALKASSGDADELKKQINNINSEAVRLRQLSSAAKAAADAEDYAMDPGNESDVLERDPASLQRIELLRVSSNEIDKVLPELILAAQSVIANPTEITRVEALELLRRVWAGNVNNLIMAVDDVTVGTSAPVEHLTNATLSGDYHALQERLRMVTSYTRSLKEMTSAATVGCSNPKKAALVESTIGSVERLTADLQDTTRTVIDLSTRENKTLEQQLAFMSIEEKMNLMRREWATKVHLLTALVDDLTAHVSAPVDRLAGAALAATKAELGQKHLMEREFEDQAQELSRRVVRVRNQASKAVEKSTHPSQVRTVRVTGDFIDRLTPQVIGAARALADNPDQDTVEHFQMLRRQWASKAQLLIATLEGLPDANMLAVMSVVQDLLSTRANLQGAASFESLTEDDSIAISGTPRLLPSATDSSKRQEPVATQFTPPRRTPSPPRKTFYVSPKPALKPSPRKRAPKVFSAFDDSDIGRKTRHHHRALSDSEALPDSPEQRVPIGASSSETDLKSLLVQELNDRFSSNESLKRSKWDARYWAKFEVERLKHQRAFSMANLSRTSPEWRSDSAEDLRARKSSKSIAMAAQLLQDETDQWEEENNSIVKVAKKMALQMMQMAQFSRGRGDLQDKMEMINTAKAIAANAKTILKFAQIIADACVDERCREDLLYYAECLPTMSTQLKIISSVKAATPSDPSADAVLVRNADNLMQAVVKTLKAAEAASVKELVKPRDVSTDEAEAADLAFQWKKKLKRQRKLEVFTASRDHLGLRRRETKEPAPSLADIVHV